MSAGAKVDHGAPICGASHSPHGAGFCHPASGRAKGGRHFERNSPLSPSRLCARHRVRAGGRQLARPSVALPGFRQRHIGIASEGHEPGPALIAIGPTPYLRPRRRNSQKQSAAIADLIWLCTWLDSLDLDVCQLHGKPPPGNVHTP